VAHYSYWLKNLGRKWGGGSALDRYIFPKEFILASHSSWQIYAVILRKNQWKRVVIKRIDLYWGGDEWITCVHLILSEQQLPSVFGLGQQQHMSPGGVITCCSLQFCCALSAVRVAIYHIWCQVMLGFLPLKKPLVSILIKLLGQVKICLSTTGHPDRALIQTSHQVQLRRKFCNLSLDLAAETTPK
jgi:hypothetical protein